MVFCACFATAMFALAPAALAQDPGASAEFRAAQEGFEDAYWRAVRDIREEPISDRMRRIVEVSEPFAQHFYGRDWSVVRAETERRLSLLERFDLTPYQDRPPAHSWAALSSGIDSEFYALLRGSPAKLAVMRFYDPRSVGGAISQMVLSGFLSAEDFRDLTLAGVYAPVRVYKGRWRSYDALVLRQGGWLVVVPYEISQYGLITPLFFEIRVYPAT
jgi:hypothetical protein